MPLHAISIRFLDPKVNTLDERESLLPWDVLFRRWPYPPSKAEGLKFQVR